MLLPVPVTWLLSLSLSFLPPTKEEVYVFGRVCLSFCLSVCEQDYSKRCAWIWMKCCMSTDAGTWINWLTCEPDPDYSLDATTGLLYPTSYVLQRGILLRQENPTCSDTWFKNGFTAHCCSDAWFYNSFSHCECEPSEQLCWRYIRSTDWPSSYRNVTQEWKLDIPLLDWTWSSTSLLLNLHKHNTANSVE